MAHWHYAQLEHQPADALIRPMIGPEQNLTRQQAHAHIQQLLDQFATTHPQMQQAANIWRQGAKDDTVYHDQFIWMIFECEGPPCGPTMQAQAEEFAQIMRQAGVDVAVAQMPDA